MKEKSLQDYVLQKHIKEENEVFVFLINGIKLEGKILKYDKETFLLHKQSSTQLIYKNATATILTKGDYNEWR